MSNQTVSYVLKQEKTCHYYQYSDCQTGIIGHCPNISEASRFKTSALAIDRYSHISWHQGKKRNIRPLYTVVKVVFVSVPEWREVEE